MRSEINMLLNEQRPQLKVNKNVCFEVRTFTKIDFTILYELRLPLFYCSLCEIW